VLDLEELGWVKFIKGKNLKIFNCRIIFAVDIHLVFHGKPAWEKT